MAHGQYEVQSFRAERTVISNPIIQSFREQRTVNPKFNHSAHTLHRILGRQIDGALCVELLDVRLTVRSAQSSLP